LFKQKAAYELSLCDWSSDVCPSDLCNIMCQNAVQHNRPMAAI
jgi:hypothetical protein